MLPIRRAALLLPILALTLSASNCKKVIVEAATPKLPEATQDGKNTFGCKLGDKVWLPGSDHMLLPPLDADLTGTGFTLRASDDHNDAPGWEEFNLSLNTTSFVPGTYTLRNGLTARYWSRENDLNNIEDYIAGSGNTGTLTITKVEPRTKTTTVLGNTVTSNFTVVSGTFEFTATTSAGKTITVKEGRFDVQAF
ncbi:hypothetical protein GCM10023186_33140 [Hymenobacter koreensis]|uniref:Lipoprotein n=2 Tax=Hymenobacter koreensis TaxID=1084523 RepID=A0ABP8J9X0_9BACT